MMPMINQQNTNSHTLSATLHKSKLIVTGTRAPLWLTLKPVGDLLGANVVRVVLAASALASVVAAVVEASASLSTNDVGL